MKTRGLVRDLLSVILEDLRNCAAVNRHVCDNHRVFNSGCFICTTCNRKYVLLLLSYLRSEGLIPGQMMESERTLLEIIGENRTNNILKQQTANFHSGPIVKCSHCGRETKYMGSYTDAYKRCLIGGGVRIDCASCGDVTNLSLDKMKVPKHFKNDPNKKPLLDKLSELSSFYNVNTNTAFTDTTALESIISPRTRPRLRRPRRRRT